LRRQADGGASAPESRASPALARRAHRLRRNNGLLMPTVESG
jgi:hypothetical protein